MGAKVQIICDKIIAIREYFIIPLVLPNHHGPDCDSRWPRRYGGFGCALSLLGRRWYGPPYHLGVTIDALIIGIPMFLYLSCLDDTFTDSIAALAGLHLGELLERHNRHLNVQVDTVKKGARYLIHITLNLSWGTDTMVCGVAVIATRTRIHRGDKHERTRILYRVCVLLLNSGSSSAKSTPL